MNYPSTPFMLDASQEKLERYLLETSVIDSEQLTLAKKEQAKQQGPLLMVLLQLGIIDLHQFSGLLDWTLSARGSTL